MDDRTDPSQPDNVPVPPPDSPVSPPSEAQPAESQTAGNEASESQAVETDSASTRPTDVTARPTGADAQPTQQTANETTGPIAADNASVDDASVDEASVDDTTEFTMSDVTFSDASRNQLRALLDGMKNGMASAWARMPWGSSTAPARTSSARRWWQFRVWQWALIGVALVVVAFGLFVAIDAGRYYDEIHSGINVAGEDLSGMTRDKATTFLNEKVREAQQNPIEIKHETRTWTVHPADFSTEIDIPGAVDSAFGLTRDGNFFSDLGKKLALYFGEEDLPLQGTVDVAKIDALIAAIAVSVEVPSSDARLVIEDGTLVVIEGQPGTQVDGEALREDLVATLFSFHSTQLAVPMVSVTPDLTADDIRSSLPDADVMTDSELLLTYQGKTLVTLSPEQILESLDVELRTAGKVSSAVPILSAEKMAAMFDSIETQVGEPGINAGLVMDPDTETLSVVEGTDGTGLDREETAAALTQAAMATGTASRTAEVVLKTVPPDLTTAEVEAMGIDDLLGSYATTPYTGSSSRQINVRLATSKCTGVLLAPGEEFNTDERFGPRNAANGWAKAPGIVGGGELEDVYGGGICQVSTTLWNAVLLAGLEIVERHNHSLYISHYPLGRDATVSAGGKNMRFRNDTENYILIWGVSDGIRTKFYIWGADDGRYVAPIKWSGWYGITGYPAAQEIPNPYLNPWQERVVVDGQRGRKCHVIRTITYADGTVNEETFYSVYPPIARVTEVPTTTTPTTGATTSTTTGPTTSTSTTAAPTTTATDP